MKRAENVLSGARNPLHLRPPLLVQSFCQESAVERAEDTVSCRQARVEAVRILNLRQVNVQKVRYNALSVTQVR